jgi:MYXO-CTERM domain-containing protein
MLRRGGLIMTWNALGVAALVAGIAWITPTVAQAGGCPVCETTEDCVAALEGISPCDDSDPCFCVQHDEPVGCGDLTRLCCPGQACATFTGRPSCETEGTCVVVGDSGSDAGTDSGAPDGATDTGTGADTGAGTDTGTGADTGTGTGGGGRDSGCGCRLVGRPTGAPVLGVLLLAALVFVRRRRS